MRNFSLENQEILHCANCGASFFEDNGINRIGIDTARHLARERYKQGLVPGHKPNCPRDEVTLKQISNTEAVPATVRLYQCPECRGMLVGADDLELFKRAQLSKLDYFKSWGLPLGSLRGVLAIGLLVALSGSVYWSYNALSNRALIRSEAEELMNKVDISFAGRYMFIGFKTSTAVKSSLIIEDKHTGRITTLPISQKPQTIHTITVDAPPASHSLIYRIQLQDVFGRTVQSQELEL